MFMFVETEIHKKIDVAQLVDKFASTVGLPYVLLLEDMSPLLTKSNCPPRTLKNPQMSSFLAI